MIDRPGLLEHVRMDMLDRSAPKWARFGHGDGPWTLDHPDPIIEGNVYDSPIP
ncbi:hypothetical protein [Nannocystis pusilla]|uniref:hypothetical protein n=1 Tax=Nannocystis pusilla TaxID=889268 RepID=UPI003BF07EA1